MLMRMTSDDPEYIASHLNIFFTQDGEGYVRSGGEDNQDIEVMDWIREAAENIDAEIWSKDDDGLCDELYDNLQYGVEYREGVIAYLYLAVLQALEMRGRLKDVEDILGDEYDLDRLRELVQADREEKCVILELKEGDPVYELYYLVKGVENPEMELKVRVVGFEKSMTGQLGKSVFISYEDAEKSVEMEKNGND